MSANPVCDASRYDKRLAIVIPYRDRAAHLAALVPHLVTYFQRDKLDRQIAVTLHVVEQTAGAPFNLGRVRNAGFLLARDAADYFCFHDVDYLPIWADYGWSATPARIAWHGLTLGEDPETFFGGVVLFDKAAFERVNGYPNCYWGWGGEDVEMSIRRDLCGLGLERRDGTFQPLPHPHAGFDPRGVPTPAAQCNRALFEQRLPTIAERMRNEGISELHVKVVARNPLRVHGKTLPGSFHYTVDIGAPE